MNAQSIVSRLLENDDIDVGQFVRGVIGFATILPKIKHEDGPVPGIQRFEKDFKFRVGWAELQVEIYYYDDTHHNRPDSAHISFAFYITQTQPVIGSANVYDLKKKSILAQVVDVVSDTINKVSEAHAAWAKTVPQDWNLTAQNTEPLRKQVEQILMDNVEALHYLGNRNMIHWRSGKVPTDYRQTY